MVVVPGPKMSDTPLHLLPSARNSPAVNGVKLRKTAGTCLWGKDVYLLLQQSLHVGSCARGSGGVVLFPELFFFPKLFLFWQVKARHLLGKCRSPLVTE